MTLADDIVNLRERSVASLVEIYDYYEASKGVWRLIQQEIRDGREILVQNPVTGNDMTEVELAARAQAYVENLASSTFQQFASLLDDFLYGFLQIWLVEYPDRLSKKTIELGAILALPDKAATIKHVIEKELNEVAYRNVREWFDYLKRSVDLGCPQQSEIDRLAEIKACRDVLVHNSGIANDVYLRKAGRLARYSVGERIEITAPYHHDIWALIRKIMEEMGNAGEAKATTT